MSNDWNNQKKYAKQRLEEIDKEREEIKNCFIGIKEQSLAYHNFYLKYGKEMKQLEEILNKKDNDFFIL